MTTTSISRNGVMVALQNVESGERWLLIIISAFQTTTAYHGLALKELLLPDYSVLRTILNTHPITANYDPLRLAACKLQIAGGILQ